MALIGMGLANYRCFVERQDIELRPITVVLGRNNSGKSALVRTPLVLSTGIRTDSPSPLDLDLLGEDVVDSFTDLLYGGRPHGSLQLDARVANPESTELAMSATVQNIDEYRQQVVSELTISSEGRSFCLRWQPDGNLSDLRYVVESDGLTERDVRVTFEGLLPSAIVGDPANGERDRALLSMASAIRAGFGEVRYLGPFRDRPARYYRSPARMPNNVGHSGEHTAGVLSLDLTRNQGKLLRQINRELKDSLPGWDVDILARGGVFNIVLRSQMDNTLAINLADTGTGVAQALPIFVQRALDVLYPSADPVLEIVEQPELHLHPAAHAALADLYLRASSVSRQRFLIETHSETILLRLRRRIAEGTADPANIAVYFVESNGGASSTRRINISQDGGLDYWPDGVFSEDYQETKALASAQISRLKSNAR
ncbi:AAA family ATPase [Actinoplanes nipponensis]|nr:DUF3696 domain-containing protein [Actinoplanes nipponensis]